MNIVESIYKEPEKWRIKSEYWFAHENGARVWIHGGALCLDVNDAKVGFFLRRGIWKAFKWWATNAPIEALGDKNNSSSKAAK